MVERLTWTGYVDPVTGAPRQGRTALSESQVDLERYTQPLQRMHAAEAHDWGIAAGLEVVGGLRVSGGTLQAQQGLSVNGDASLSGGLTVGGGLRSGPLTVQGGLAATNALVGVVGDSAVDNDARAAGVQGVGRGLNATGVIGDANNGGLAYGGWVEAARAMRGSSAGTCTSTAR